jgi:hypothetical protein
MSCCKILPKDLVLGQETGFFYGPIGTGPFKFSSWLRTPRLAIAGVRMEKNASYFGRRPLLDGIDYSPSFTEEHFLEREIDVIPYFDERLAPAAPRRRGLADDLSAAIAASRPSTGRPCGGRSPSASTKRAGRLLTGGSLPTRRGTTSRPSCRGSCPATAWTVTTRTRPARSSRSRGFPRSALFLS